MSMLDIDFSILLDNVTIARSRKHITKYYDTSEIGKFPTRRKPISYYCDIAERENTLEYKDIFTTLINLTMAVYAPMNYIQPSKVAKYEDLYDTQVGASTLKQTNREKALQRLMTINMLKRLESCVDSFRITVRKVREVNLETYNSILEYEKNKHKPSQQILRTMTSTSPQIAPSVKLKLTLPIWICVRGRTTLSKISTSLKYFTILCSS